MAAELAGEKSESWLTAPHKCLNRKLETGPQCEMESGSGKEFIKCDI
jgi:hypothetical protein